MGGLAAFAGLIPQLPDFAGAGMNYAIGKMNSRQQRRDIRHLRRRVYQDQMFSMKEAGLNPLLASGATPQGGQTSQAPLGATGGSAGIGMALAAHKQANTAKKLGDVEVENKMYQRGLLNSQVELTNSATQLNRSLDAKAKQETTESTARQIKILSDSDLADASAKKIGEETKGVNYLNAVREMEADLSNIPERDFLNRLNLWSSALQGGNAAGKHIAPRAK